MNERFHIDRRPWKDGVDIYFGMELGDGIFARALPVQMQTRDPDKVGIPAEPMLTVSGPGAETALQSLMDELWREGYRPKDIGTAGHLAATQAHLADFRALVSKALDVKLP